MATSPLELSSSLLDIVGTIPSSDRLTLSTENLVWLKGRSEAFSSVIVKPKQQESYILYSVARLLNFCCLTIIILQSAIAATYLSRGYLTPIHFLSIGTCSLIILSMKLILTIKTLCQIDRASRSLCKLQQKASQTTLDPNQAITREPVQKSIKEIGKIIKTQRSFQIASSISTVVSIIAIVALIVGFCFLLYCIFTSSLIGCIPVLYGFSPLGLLLMTSGATLLTSLLFQLVVSTVSYCHTRKHGPLCQRIKHNLKNLAREHYLLSNNSFYHGDIKKHTFSDKSFLLDPSHEKKEPIS